MVGVRVVVVVVSACGVPVGVMVGVGVVRRRRRASDRGRLGGSRQEGRAGGPVVLELVKPDAPDPAQEDQAGAEGNRAEDPHGNPDRLVWTPGRGLVRSPTGRPAQAPHAPGRGARRPVQGDSGGSAGSGAEAGDSIASPELHIVRRRGRRRPPTKRGPGTGGWRRAGIRRPAHRWPPAGWRDPRRAGPPWMPWVVGPAPVVLPPREELGAATAQPGTVRAAPARNRAEERRAAGAWGAAGGNCAPHARHSTAPGWFATPHHWHSRLPMVVSSSPSVAGVSRWPASSRGRPPGGRQRCYPR